MSTQCFAPSMFKKNKDRLKLSLNKVLWLFIALHLGLLTLVGLVNFPEDQLSLQAESSRNLLDSFNPALHPVIGNFHEYSKLRVGLIVEHDGPLGEGKHVMYDGISGSDYMELVGVYQANGKNYDTFQNVQLWVIDNVRVRASTEDEVDFFIAGLFLNSTTPVLVIDFHDDPYREYGYMAIFGAVDKPHVRLAKRSIVLDRYLTKQSNIHLGHLQENNGTAEGPTLHISYCVRNDIVNEIRRQTSFPPGMNRSLDVVHLWNVNDTKYFSSYRSRVSSLVEAMQGREVAGRAIRTSTELQGEHSHAGRWNANPEYVAMLLRSKIVVVTQRDRWEDSYRLMEALTAGGMVLADTMLAPPPGIVDRVHLRFFSSWRDLRKLIIFYLEHKQDRKQIAQAGLEEAMGRHRSWHRMEEVVLGKLMV